MSHTETACSVLGLNMVEIAGMLIVGLTSRSLGVLAAGGDYAVDSIAILLGIMAIKIAKHPHGHPKATTYVTGINGLVLLVVTGFVLVGGTRRLITPEIHGLSVMIVSLASRPACSWPRSFLARTLADRARRWPSFGVVSCRARI